MLEIFLTAVEDELASAWSRFTSDLHFVHVHQGSIFDVPADAFVSPANSFGFMDGGIDLAYSHRFGWNVQKRLQELIRDRHNGELLVGTAEIVETGATGKQRPLFIIGAPTMRVPMILHDSVNPYLAARAVLLLIQQGTFSEANLRGEPVKNAVHSVAFPGLGTGIGRVGPNTCARQLRAAIDEVLLGQNPFPRTWAEASLRHQSLYTDHPRNLQREP